MNNKIYDYEGNTIISSIVSRYLDKNITCFGDSRTWYDGQTYTNNCKDEWKGKTCKGYQYYIREYLNANTINEGVSGETSVQICNRIRAYDFSNTDVVLLCGGVNDTNVSIGNLEEEGSTFNTNTIYGAWQSAIEYISVNYPNIKIIMVVPVIAWRTVSDTVYSYDRAVVKKIVAEYYNVPVLNLYKTSGINKENRDYYFADNVETTNWHLHLNDYGNKLIGEVMAMFINNN